MSLITITKKIQHENFTFVQSGFQQNDFSLPDSQGSLCPASFHVFFIKVTYYIYDPVNEEN